MFDLSEYFVELTCLNCSRVGERTVWRIPQLSYPVGCTECWESIDVFFPSFYVNKKFKGGLSVSVDPQM